MINPEGFTQELQDICEKRCAETAGEPPCWKLPEITEPCEHITPCEECLADMKGGDA